MLSKFRPDPSLVQSGYYTDRMGTKDHSVRVDGNMHKSAAEENSSGRVAPPGAAPVSTGAPSPEQLQRMVSGEGGAESRKRTVQVDGHGYVRVNQPLASIPEADGALDVAVLEAEVFIQKSEDAEDEDEDEDEDGAPEETDEEEVGDDVDKGYGKQEGSKEKVEKSMESALHRAAMHRGMSQEDADDFIMEGPLGLSMDGFAKSRGYVLKGGKYVRGNGVKKSGFGLDEMREWIAKSERRPGFRPETAESVLDSFLGEDDEMRKAEYSGHSTAGQGGFAKVGDPHKDLPTKQCASDGDGDREMGRTFSGPQDAGVATAATTSGAPDVEFDDITFESKDDVDFQNLAGGQRWTSLPRDAVGPMRKSDHLQSSLDFRSELERRINDLNWDISPGIGVAPEPVQLEKSMVEDVLELSEDERVEKAMKDYGNGGLSFAQTSVAGVDLRSPLLTGKECGACGQLMKSYLTTCDRCGTPERHAHGMTVSEEVSKSLVGPLDEDIFVG